jgi:ABC-type uncharacterized transport system ATPase subunit
MVVFGMFSAGLDARLEGMDLQRGVRTELEKAKADLGAAEAPEGVDAGTAARIERAIDESFVAGFRAVMLVSAGLALSSALAVTLLVGGKVRSKGGAILQAAPREETAAREREARQPVTVGAA